MRLTGIGFSVIYVTASNTMFAFVYLCHLYPKSSTIKLSICDSNVNFAVKS